MYFGSLLCEGCNPESRDNIYINYDFGIHIYNECYEYLVSLSEVKKYTRKAMLILL